MYVFLMFAYVHNPHLHQAIEHTHIYTNTLQIPVRLALGQCFKLCSRLPTVAAQQTLNPEPQNSKLEFLDSRPQA